MRSVEEVRAYATALHDILVYLGVNSGDMEKGVMRFEANVSVRPVGETRLGTRTEIKNLNSFRALTRAVEYEISRQIALLEAGGKVVQQTMGWNEERGETYPQRSKEQAHDYRYFPEPDIPPLVISREWLEEVRARLPELPLAKKRRFMADYGIRAYEAELLIADRAIADYFERSAQLAASQGIAGQEVANWVTGEIFRLFNEAGLTLDTLNITPEALVALLALRQAGTLSSTAAKTVLEEMAQTGETPEAIVQRLGLAQVSDRDALLAIVEEVVANSPRQTQQYREGKTAVMGWFVGQVMKASQGKANPAQVQELLKQVLER